MMKHLSQNRYQHDGYLRLTLPELASMHLVHLHSAEDTSVKGMLDSLCIPSRQAGYTEWWVPTIHLSIGWDWYVEGSTAQMRMAPWELRSNVMLVTVDAWADMGARASEHLLRQHLAGLDWAQQLAVELAHACSHMKQSVAGVAPPPFCTETPGGMRPSHACSPYTTGPERQLSLVSVERAGSVDLNISTI